MQRNSLKRRACRGPRGGTPVGGETPCACCLLRTQRSGALLYPPGTAANLRQRPCHNRADVTAIRDGTKFTVEYGIQTPTSKTILVVTEDLEEAQRTLDMIVVASIEVEAQSRLAEA